jgi:hypothetical protein
MRLSVRTAAGDGADARRRARVVWVDAVTGGRRLGLAFERDDD